MDLFEANKIAGAVLFSLLLALGLGTLSRIIYSAETPEKPGYLIEVAEQQPTEGEAEPEAVPLPTLLASANPEDGQSVSRKCASCHTFEQGGANKIGPNLYNIVGNDIASKQNFSYSDAMSSKEGDWTYQELSNFLEDPRGYVQGTKMAFAGVRKPQDLADLISYLRTLSENPPPLPEVEAEPESTDRDQAASGEQSDGAAATGEQSATEAPASGDQSAEAPSGEQSDGAAATGEQSATEAPASGDQSAGAAPAPANDQSGGGQQGGLGPRLAAASADEGKKVSRKCAACHTFDKGGATRVGPNLYGVVGRDVASVEDYSYSDAMQAKEGDWTYRELFAYLADPQSYVEGTKMQFPGVKKEEDRLNLIAFLRAMSDNPPPLPEVEAEPASTGGDGAAPANDASGGDASSGGNTAADRQTGDSDAGAQQKPEAPPEPATPSSETDGSAGDGQTQ